MLLDYENIIKEVAIHATATHCKVCECKGCQERYFDDCADKVQLYFADQIITALAIEIVKEKANESKD